MDFSFQTFHFSFSGIRSQACPNSACRAYQKAGQANIIIHSRKHSRVQCKTCKASWVTRLGTPYYRLHKEVPMMVSANELLGGGMSIRKTAEGLRVSPSTIQRWKKKLLVNSAGLLIGLVMLVKIL